MATTEVLNKAKKTRATLAGLLTDNRDSPRVKNWRKIENAFSEKSPLIDVILCPCEEYNTSPCRDVCGNQSVGGMAFPIENPPRIVICRSQLNDALFGNTLVHELSHIAANTQDLTGPKPEGDPNSAGDPNDSYSYGVDYDNEGQIESERSNTGKVTRSSYSDDANRRHERYRKKK